ncbi:Catalase [Granulicella sibirica]|uniref:Catalase n=1 Tax=Granulicella sibirica TaxID=2479048 RepID=A0A4Q0SVV2_9BACT|nr:Catalase [Granulicella sibirica]
MLRLRQSWAANAQTQPAFKWNMSHIYASGNIAADMYCNVAAETTGRALAVASTT